MSSAESDLTALFSALSSLTADGACRAALEKVLDMQQQLAELKSARKLHTRELRQAEDKLEKAERELERQKGQIAGLSDTLRQRTSQLDEAREEFEKEKADSQEIYKVITADMEAKTRRLEELEGFTSKLEPASPSNVASIFTRLYRDALALGQKYFGREIEDIAGKAGASWVAFGDHPEVEDKIPLPLSNSRAAQQMRTAAFLVILSTALRDYVFRPTYAVGVDRAFLWDTAAREPQLEAHLRSVLLRAQPEGERKLEARKLAGRAAQEVMDHLSGMLGDKQDEMRLGTELEAFCERAAEEWQAVQALDRVFVPIMRLDKLPGPRDWNIVDFDSKAGKESGNIQVGSKDQQQSDTDASSIGTTRGASKAKGSGAPGSDYNTPAAPTAERVVWPSLVMCGPVEVTVAIGYALSDGQTRAARVEKSRSVHRDHRARLRAGSSSAGEHSVGGGRLGMGSLRRGGGRGRREA